MSFEQSVTIKQTDGSEKPAESGDVDEEDATETEDLTLDDIIEDYARP